MREGDGLAKDVGNDLTIGIDRLSVAQRALYAPLVLVSLHRTPATLAEDAVGRHCPRTLRTNDGDVGTIAWTQEATLLDASEN